MEGENNTTYAAGTYPEALRAIPGVDIVQEMTLVRPLTELQKKMGNTPQPGVETCTLKQARRRYDKGWEFIGLGDPLGLTVEAPIVAEVVSDPDAVEVAFGGDDLIDESDDEE